MATATEAPARAIRFPLSRLDIAGAFGDIGVLFPIAIALISLNHMNPTAVFLAAGLAYILAGAYFRIPMAVQPFKAVAAVALAMSLPPSSIASAGLLLGLLLAFLAVTNLVTPLARLFTLPIIRGIQLGLGLILLREGIRLAVNSSALSLGRLALPSWGIALAGSVLLLAFLPSKRFPAALILLGGGVVLGAMAPHGAVFDAGVEIDAGNDSDAGAEFDAGADLDAGETDAGEIPPDAGSMTTTAKPCGCAQAGS